MKNITKLLLIVIITFTLQTISFAADSACAGGQVTNIYFGNGMGNSLADAKMSLNLIRGTYSRTLKNSYPDQTFNFVLAYNVSQGFGNDVLEVFIQKVGENTDLAEHTPQEYLAMIKSYNKAEFDTSLGETLRDAYVEILKQRMFQQIITDSHVQKYRSDLMEGKRVIIFAHSQGNLFANEAVNSVLTDNSEFSNNIGIIGVASPANRVIGSNVYYTAEDDFVIGGLREVRDVLASNVDNDPGIFNDFRDKFNHSFIESYMDGNLTSSGLINTAFNDLITNLEFPTSELTDGAIKVTLEWGAEPDVDLHVYEPDSTHVYYQNMAGNSGNLDKDDTSSYGPEHYFVACDKVQTGTYTIGVNYYSGSGTETARVQISTADGRTVNKSQSLSSAVGSSGNSSPISVGSVEVTQDDSGSYLYEIK
ncbi:MAG: hypothetical protein C0603_11915 [Denitrovibrio sp.]|nr:MAG: hypothetical protein C0603_11915 [Denitrovibrio sp.]